MIKDFPDWFIEFANEQLKDFPKNVSAEYFENKSIGEVQIEYIKVWSVVETFAKIIRILADKRSYLLEIQPKLEQLAIAKTEFDEFADKLGKLIKFYKDDLRGEKSSLQFTKIQALKKNIKAIECTKFSTSKNVIVKMTLPNKQEIEKSLRILSIRPPKFCEFLNANGQQTQYYETRNNIAHSGFAGITKQTLIKNRLLPVMQMSCNIRNYTKNNLTKV